ncbi:type II toxin-antitoxin system HicB family antitoxin [Methanosarcina horonobensis]|uniref:type II toxin-antitoxin system HicB family antitoxin n=1 Tax=Methanosarcina horonobensis TaxID=418008 RepID=UPI000A4E2117|nr:type II toxin-antitoxin system HicB family antitoxin [Methanosarcina horonobensis]
MKKSENGGYVAFVPDLPGCHTQGDTLEDVRKYIKDAIQLYLEVESDYLNEEPTKFVSAEMMQVEI